jgi:rhodanese-related sulfurtransferase
MDSFEALRPKIPRQLPPAGSGSFWKGDYDPCGSGRRDQGHNLRFQSVKTITREELKAKLDGSEDFGLVNCLDDWMFRAKRIPGSIHFESLKHALETLDPEKEVIVYCSNFGCTASVMVYQLLVDHCFRKVTHYPGGIADWEDAGYPLEGDRVNQT